MQDNYSFLVDQAALIEATVYRTRYPAIRYPQLIPISSDAPAWIRTITHMSQEVTGRAEWLDAQATGMPIIDMTRQKHEVTVGMAGIGYRVTDEDIEVARFAGIDLSADSAIGARRKYEEYMDNLVINGDADKNWYGLISQPTVDVAADGTHRNQPGVNRENVSIGAAGADDAAKRLWINKTPQEIIRDVNDAVGGVSEDTEDVEQANTLLLPREAYNVIANKSFGDNTPSTILRYVLENNVYTTDTGQPLLVRSVRGLENAGAGMTGRMVAYRREPDVLRLHVPMPHEFLQPFQTGPMEYVIGGRFRTSGVELKLPKAMRYLDGVTA